MAVFKRLALAALLALGFSSPAAAFWHGAPSVITVPTISPPSAWTGTSPAACDPNGNINSLTNPPTSYFGSSATPSTNVQVAENGASCPDASGTDIYGSALSAGGFNEPVIANSDQPDWQLIDNGSNFVITIGAISLDPARANIDHIVVWLEGATITLGSHSVGQSDGQNVSSRTGAQGWQFIPYSRTGQNGPATLCFTAYPVNGSNQTICKSVYLNTDPTGANYINRSASANQYYADSLTGSDTACDGTASAASPGPSGNGHCAWATLTGGTAGGATLHANVMSTNHPGSVLNINPNSGTVTSATHSGSTSTVNYTGSYTYAVGSFIALSGVGSPVALTSTYNGVHKVTASSAGQVQFTDVVSSTSAGAGGEIAAPYFEDYPTSVTVGYYICDAGHTGTNCAPVRFQSSIPGTKYLVRTNIRRVDYFAPFSIGTFVDADFDTSEFNFFGGLNWIKRSSVTFENSLFADPYGPWCGLITGCQVVFNNFNLFRYPQGTVGPIALKVGSNVNLVNTTVAAPGNGGGALYVNSYLDYSDNSFINLSKFYQSNVASFGTTQIGQYTYASARACAVISGGSAPLGTHCFPSADTYCAATGGSSGSPNGPCPTGARVQVAAVSGQSVNGVCTNCVNTGTAGTLLFFGNPASGDTVVIGGGVTLTFGSANACGSGTSTPTVDRSSGVLATTLSNLLSCLSGSTNATLTQWTYALVGAALDINGATALTLTKTSSLNNFFKIVAQAGYTGGGYCPVSGNANGCLAVLWAGAPMDALGNPCGPVSGSCFATNLYYFEDFPAYNNTIMTCWHDESAFGGQTSANFYATPDPRTDIGDGGHPFTGCDVANTMDGVAVSFHSNTTPANREQVVTGASNSGNVSTLTFTGNTIIAAGTSITTSGITGYTGTFTVLASPAPGPGYVSFTQTSPVATQGAGGVINQGAGGSLPSVTPVVGDVADFRWGAHANWLQFVGNSSPNNNWQVTNNYNQRMVATTDRAFAGGYTCQGNACLVNGSGNTLTTSGLNFTLSNTNGPQLYPHNILNITDPASPQAYQGVVITSVTDAQHGTIASRFATPPAIGWNSLPSSPTNAVSASYMVIVDGSGAGFTTGSQGQVSFGVTARDNAGTLGIIINHVSVCVQATTGSCGSNPQVELLFGGLSGSNGQLWDIAHYSDYVTFAFNATDKLIFIIDTPSVQVNSTVYYTPSWATTYELPSCPSGACYNQPTPTLGTIHSSRQYTVGYFITRPVTPTYTDVSGVTQWHMGWNPMGVAFVNSLIYSNSYNSDGFDGAENWGFVQTMWQGTNGMSYINFDCFQNYGIGFQALTALDSILGDFRTRNCPFNNWGNTFGLAFDNNDFMVQPTSDGTTAITLGTNYVTKLVKYQAQSVANSNFTPVQDDGVSACTYSGSWTCSLTKQMLGNSVTGRPLVPFDYYNHPIGPDATTVPRQHPLVGAVAP